MQWLLTPAKTAQNSAHALRMGHCRRLGLLLLLAGYSLPGAAQRLESAGLSNSLNVTQTLARPYVIDMGSYALDTKGDNSRYDEIGYRLAAYARWQLGTGRFFVQPEVAYTSTRGQAYKVLYDLTNSQFGPSFLPLVIASTAGKQPRWEACIRGNAPTFWLGRSSLSISRNPSYRCARATRPPRLFTTACLRAYYPCNCWHRWAWASPSAASTSTCASSKA